jgi:hypothetical protein
MFLLIIPVSKENNFDARCGQQGDVIDLWAALPRMRLRDAALDLVRTFDLEPGPAQRTEKRNG